MKRIRAIPLSVLFGLGFVSTSLAACEEGLADGKAYKAYAAVFEALKDGAAPETVADLDCFIGGADGLDAAEAYRRLVTASFEPDVLYDYLVSAERAVFRKARASGSPSGPLAWNGGYLAEAAIAAYERTGERRFLDFFVRYFDRVLGFRDSERGVVDLFHGRVMHSWGEVRPAWVWYGPVPVRVGVSVAHITHAARILLAPSAFIRLVRSDPALADYRADADRYLDASLTALAEFDEDRIRVEGTDEHWYWRPVTGEVEATNHIHTLGSVYINLAEATGDADMRRQVEKLVAIFEKGVTMAKDGTVHWKYFPYFADQSIGPNGREYSERIWKASQTVPFVMRAHAAGYDVPDGLVEAITRTFLAHIVRDNEVMRNLSPKQSRPADGDDEDVSHLSGIVTWLEASAVEPAIAARLRDVVASRPDLFPDGWFQSPNSARGYAFFLGSD